MGGKKLFAMLLSLPVLAAAGELGYVAENLKIGIHENASLKSTILELVPSGTELEILERDGEGHARVRIVNGIEGWVDARYLRQGIPAQRRVQELEEELLQTATELAGARDQVAELEFQLNKARAEAAALGAGAGQPISAGNDVLTSETLRELQKLAEENQGLKQRVAELEAVQTMTIERALAEQSPSSPAPEPAATNGTSGFFSRYLAILYWPAWKQILLVSAMLLLFAAGAYLVDWDVRRRHGGFRV